MPSNAEAIIRINHAGKQQINDAVVGGIAEVFGQDIWPEATKGSPVKTGHNRRTIAVEVNGFGEPVVAQSGTGETSGQAQPTPFGVSAAVYTQSGYGGYLETGTRKMSARPYIYPAVMKFMGSIGEVVRRRLGGE